MTGSSQKRREIARSARPGVPFPACVASRERGSASWPAWPSPGWLRRAGPAGAPTYTQAELRARRERGGGWWHPGGFCEPNSQ
ncbi:MAG TPA: hypothetical protein VFO08_13100, partial [Methylomirabilota bacterium]|nr:hypothetical protein [Methylomirabilota bacterium]